VIWFIEGISVEKGVNKRLMLKMSIVQTPKYDCVYRNAVQDN